MPDANEGGVAVFPFMKRTIGDFGKSIAAGDLLLTVAVRLPLFRKVRIVCAQFNSPHYRAS
jgi:hypothetical protein